MAVRTKVKRNATQQTNKRMKRKGVHSKCKASKCKTSKNYLKKAIGQGS